MNNLHRIFSTRMLLALLFVLMLPFVAHAQKDILLYSTDFTDWTQLNYHPGYGEDTFTDSGMSTTVNGSTTFNGGGNGNGFTLQAKPAVMPTGTVSGQKGYAIFGNSSGTMFTFSPFTFVSGGAVEITFYHDYSNHTSGSPGSSISTRNFTLDYGGSTTGITTTVNAVPTGVSFTSNQPLVGATAVTALNTAYSGSKFTTAKTSGFYTVTFTLPTTLVGAATINIVGGSCKDLYIKSIKVYSGVATTPYVASTNYAQYPVSGHILTGTSGGAKYSGVASNSKIKIKEWNSSSDVKLTIEGSDAAKFSFSNTTDLLTNTIANADVLNIEKEITIYFTPSVRAGVSNAKLKIEAAGVTNPYYVSLTGVTGGTTPQIVADTATIPFWTSVIEPISQTLNISGLNLTGDITLSLSGNATSRISLSTTTITKANALSGTSVTITYLGDIETGTKNAVLTLSSTGAQDVKIPLKCVTFETTPKLYSLMFDVSPTGSAYVSTSPAGTKFLSGSTVTVVVTPETGYTISSWQDLPSNSRKTRTFTVGELKNTDNGDPITITLTSCPNGNCQPCVTCDCDPSYCSSTFIAYKAMPDASNNTILQASWTAATGATASTVYSINVYDENNNLLHTYTSSTTNFTIPNLNAGTQYKYNVKTTVGTTNYDSGIIGPFKTSGSSSTFVCGQ